MSLFETPRERRDDGWRAAFLEAIVDASLASKAEQVVRRPDGFPYFVLVKPPVAQASWVTARQDFQEIMNASGWFLPMKRSCVAVSRKTFEPSAFIPL